MDSAGIERRASERADPAVAILPQKEKAMFKKVRPVIPLLTLCGTLPFLTIGQAQEPAAPVRPDTAPEVKTHLDAAKKLAGTEWISAINFFCVAPRANASDDPLLEPTKLFDNVYAVGRTETTVYAITTSDGIILIDSGYPNQAESVIVPGMMKLGLDPSKVKLVIVTHGHGDHGGGSVYFQEKYGAKVALSAADWDFMLPKPGEAPKGKANNPLPKRDVIAVEGQPLTLGDEQVTPVMTPGHTPGAMALIFPVKEGGRTHIAGLYGGTILLPMRPPKEIMDQYLASAQHYAEVAKKMKVDVELQNHPLMDGMADKLGKLRGQKPGDSNPFIVGEAGYGRFTGVMIECFQVQMARRGF
jgi:metallo-beta-lactamase class B